MDSPPVEHDLPALLARLRPRLHRYLARMAGSVFDGEDLVQEVCVKVLAAGSTPVRNGEGWIFSIAHNAAMDLLRGRARERELFAVQPEELAETTEIERREVASLALRVFMLLPASQRSAVLLADVLEHPLAEAATVAGATLPAFKASLHRGRVALQKHRELPPEPDAPLSPAQQQLLELYAARFNARDFDGLLALMAADVRLDLVGRPALLGRDALSVYFGNYRRLQGARAAPCLLEGRPAIRVEHLDAAGQPQPAYAVAFEIVDGSIRAMCDFHHARYAMEGVRWS
ncbi:RNA polymerase sigma factor [Ramlibacter sp. G-1-2-2]|uniref:RNA polymerase sigma factor n=1 Tax=Ramlibacter agri TaxID=2728837 RepID=A0A848H4S3_9BURK|nr:RNA polymerase sigma factor [Ramlibacter agri]NML44792.1 RNA polymerase sigma factor [Ramlibacter agri]